MIDNGDDEKESGKAGRRDRASDRIVLRRMVELILENPFDVFC